MWANVRSDGTLKHGTAVSASRDSKGDYTVTFGQDIGECAALATIGTAKGGVVNPKSRIYAHLPGNDTVGVLIYEDPIVPADSDFHLLVVC